MGGRWVGAFVFWAIQEERQPSLLLLLLPETLEGRDGGRGRIYSIKRSNHLRTLPRWAMVDNSVVRWRAFESKSIKMLFFSKSLLRFSLRRVIFFFAVSPCEIEWFEPKSWSGQTRGKKNIQKRGKNLLTMNELMYRQVFSSGVVFLMSSAFNMIGWNWRAETTRHISIARRQMFYSTSAHLWVFLSLFVVVFIYLSPSTIKGLITKTHRGPWSDREKSSISFISHQAALTHSRHSSLYLTLACTTNLI